MDDRQLLEDAARAAGYSDALALNPYWNPITDAGDALRLAVKLRMNIAPMRNMVDGKEVGWNVWPAGRGDCSSVEDSSDAPALCRAITRAAAELWRAQQEGRTDGN